MKAAHPNKVVLAFTRLSRKPKWLIPYGEQGRSTWVPYPIHDTPFELLALDSPRITR